MTSLSPLSLITANFEEGKSDYEPIEPSASSDATSVTVELAATSAAPRHSFGDEQILSLDEHNR